MKKYVLPAFCLLAGLPLVAQTSPEPDVLVFTDGEKLIGHLVDPPAIR
jgi:hypothetical protein